MKKLIVITMVGAGLLTASCNTKQNFYARVTQKQSVAVKKGEVLTVDTTSSVIGWKGFHKGGFAPRWGTLNVKSGNVSIQGGQITSGNFIIDMTTIKVDPASVVEKDKSDDLQTHLKSPDFLDVEKNPVSDFTITNVTDLQKATIDAVSGANKTVSGNLTLLGKIMNITFPAKVEVTDRSISIHAKFTVNRTDLGIQFGTSEVDPAQWMISKDIEITVNVRAIK
ncbi:YceI family protein [Chryseobacterium sp. CBSDS_008]|uniref:YceI family protein n=1 Tax=Chryseobacterium sp. CBSDS_008 TaxID=3415265 RepID=UPI003CF0F064